jgi:hypothetical protein
MKCKRLCWLVGHTEVFNDSGYAVCSCGAHQYWDQDDPMGWDNPGLIYRPIHFIRRIFWNRKEWMSKRFVKCGDCGKYEKFFGKNVGDHWNCVPF